jgi:hypothetical protein
MRAVWLRVRAGLRQDWRSPLVLALMTGLMGSLVLVSLAGARRTDTAVPRFLAWSGPTEGQVAGVPFATLGRLRRLPGLAYSERGAFMLMAASPAGHPAAARPGQVTTWALIDTPPQSRAIVVAGWRPNPARADEVMINEAAARVLGAHVGSVIQLRGFRPSQVMAVLNNQALHPTVTLPDVRVVTIIRTPSDLANSGAPSDVTFAGTGSLFLTAAFYHRFAGSVGNMAGLSFHLRRGLAGLPAFKAEVNRLTGGRAQFELGSDDAIAAAAVQRGTGLQALALLLFGLIVALAMLVIVGQSVARLPRAPGARIQPGTADRRRAGSWGAGRGGRDGPGHPGRLRAVGIHAGGPGPAGRDLARVLVRHLDPAGRGGPAHAPADRAGRAGRPAGGLEAG